MTSFLTSAKELQQQFIEAANQINEALLAFQKAKIASELLFENFPSTPLPTQQQQPQQQPQQNNSNQQNYEQLEDLKGTQEVVEDFEDKPQTSFIESPSASQATETTQLPHFVTVTDSISNQGMFWCRLLNQDLMHDQKIANEISDALGWSVKDLQAHTAPANCAVNTPIFFFSLKHQLYVRAAILKHEANKHTVNLMDFGGYQVVGKETQMYFLPLKYQDHTKYPYQAYPCSLFEEETELPYPAKWRFRDLTTDKLFKATLNNWVVRENQFCCVVKLYRVPDNIDLHAELIQKITESEKTEKKVNWQDASKESAVVVEDTELPKDIEDVPINKPKNNEVKNSTENLINKQRESLRKHQSMEDLSPRKLLAKQPRRNSLTDATASLASPRVSILSKLFTPKDDDKRKKMKEENEIVTVTKKELDMKQIPPLQNLFYTSDKLDTLQTWQKTEFFNISNLLKSKAVVRFFQLPLRRARIEDSLADNGQVYINYCNYQNDLPSKCSVYVFLTCYQDRKCKDQFVAVAKLVSFDRNPHFQRNTSSRDKRKPTLRKLSKKFVMTLCYLSVSCVSLPEAVNRRSQAFTSVPLSEAKAIVQCYAMNLQKGTISPFTKDFYPWNGVIPLKESRQKESKQDLSAEGDASDLPKESRQKLSKQNISSEVDLLHSEESWEMEIEANEEEQSPEVDRNMERKEDEQQRNEAETEEKDEQEQKDEVEQISDSSQESAPRQDSEKDTPSREDSVKDLHDVSERSKEECLEKVNTEEDIKTNPPKRVNDDPAIVSMVPTAILKRPATGTPTTGYYDITGMWFPGQPEKAKQTFASPSQIPINLDLNNNAQTPDHSVRKKKTSNSSGGGSNRNSPTNWTNNLISRTLQSTLASPDSFRIDDDIMGEEKGLSKKHSTSANLTELKFTEVEKDLERIIASPPPTQ